MEKARGGGVDGSAVSGLVLGYDGGCKTCADLAGRVRDASGGKISLRNLHDPEVRNWRAAALGEDAPWAPTLFEVADGEVRAWIGWRMGARLARRLGPLATWRVLRAIGEATEEAPAWAGLPRPFAAAVAADAATQAATEGRSPVGSGMSRRRFLTGIGGTAAAVSILSGGPMFVSPASALTTAERKRIAVATVKRSAPYKELAAMQARIGATFQWSVASIRLRRDWALVKVNSSSSRRTVVTIFGVGLKSRKVIWHRHQVVIPVSATRTQYLSYEEGEPLAHFHQVARQGDPAVVEQEDLVSTADGRTMTVAELGEEATALAPQAGPSDHWEPEDDCDACIYQEYNDCLWSIDAALLFDPTGVGSLITVFSGAEEAYCENVAHDSMVGCCADECGLNTSGNGWCPS